MQKNIAYTFGGIIIVILACVGLFVLLKQINPSVSSSRDQVTSLDSLLTQQSNVISWFTLVCTIAMTLILTVAGLGYFDAKYVREKLVEAESIRENYIKLREDAKRTLDEVNLLNNFISAKIKAIETLPIPISFIVPPFKQRLRLISQYSDLDWIIEHQKPISEKTIFWKMVYHYQQKEYQLCLNLNVNSLDLKRSEVAIMSTYLRALSHKALKNPECLGLFKAVLTACPNYLSAAWHYYNERCRLQPDYFEVLNVNVSTDYIDIIGYFLSCLYRDYSKGAIHTLQILHDNGLKTIHNILASYQNAYIIFSNPERPHGWETEFKSIVESIFQQNIHIVSYLPLEDSIFQEYRRLSREDFFLLENNIEYDTINQPIAS